MKKAINWLKEKWEIVLSIAVIFLIVIGANEWIGWFTLMLLFGVEAYKNVTKK
jgi:hypothetical protein